MWMVSTKGDVINFRVNYVIEGKVEKEIHVPHYIISHSELIARCWITEVFNHLRFVDWNEFMAAFPCALELRGYEMGYAMQYREL